MTKRKTQTRPTLTFKTTYLSDVGIRTLGNHALTLPANHPARATIRLLIERWVEQGTEVTFPARLAGAADTEQVFDGLEDVMQEAA